MPSDNVDRPLTLIAYLPDDIHKKVHHEDILSKLLQKLDVSDVACVQFMPNGYVRLTFSSMEARSEAFLSGIFYDSLRLRVFEAQPSVYNVYVHHLLFEVPDSALEEVLSSFGVVHSITEQTYPDSPIYSGTHVVKMTVTDVIPANLRVLRFPCRVYHKNQPMSCYICKKSHRAAECPLRDVCRRCRQPGHFAKDCTDVPESAPAAPPATPAAPPPAPAASPPAPANPPSAPAVPVNSPSRPAADPEPAVDDDDDPDYSPEVEMSSASSKSDGELTTGNEEVVSQASSVPLSQPSSADSVPSTPAPLPARVPHRRKYKPKIDVTTVHSRKSAKLSTDPLPAVPAAPDHPPDSAVQPSDVLMPDKPVPHHPPVDSAVQSSDVPTPEEPVSMFPPPRIGYHPPEFLGPFGISAEDHEKEWFACYSADVAVFSELYRPLDESKEPIPFPSCLDFGPATDDILTYFTSFEEIRWADGVSNGFSVFGPDCPPSVDLPCLPDVAPAKFPKKKNS